MSDPRPSFSRRISSFWLRDQGHSATLSTSPSTVTENTPLLGNSSGRHCSSPPSCTASQPRNQLRSQQSIPSTSAVTPSFDYAVTPPALTTPSVNHGSHNVCRPLQVPTVNTQQVGPAASSARLSILRAATTTAVPTHASPSVTPLLSRPMLQRSAATTTAVPRPPLNRAGTSTKPSRPSLLRRATDIVNSTLDLDPKTSYTQRNAPPTPSH